MTAKKATNIHSSTHNKAGIMKEMDKIIHDRSISGRMVTGELYGELVDIKQVAINRLPNRIRFEVVFRVKKKGQKATIVSFSISRVGLKKILKRALK
jgi:hypothetical protein